jgi:hypothetical protein
MNEPLKLETETFRAIGRRWTGVRTALSPLESGAMPIAPAALQEYQAMGLLDAGGQPTPGLNGVLSVLGQANAMVDLTLLAEGIEIQYTMYFSPSGAAPVLVTTIGSTTTIHPTASADPIVNDLAEKMPVTEGSPTFSADLPPKEARVLAALIDQQRMSAQDASSAQSATPIPPVVYYPFELEQILQNFTKSPPSWLLLSMVTTLTDTVPLSSDEIGKALSGLLSEGHLNRSGQGYILRQNLLSLANRILSPGFALLCAIRILGPEGTTGQMDFDSIVFDGGILSVISRADSTGALSLKAMAPEGFLDIVRRLAESPHSVGEALGIPDLPGFTAPQPVRQGKAPSGSFCPACGSPAAAGAKFCRSCGAPLEQPADTATCTECGQPLRPGARFCPKCGQKTER